MGVYVTNKTSSGFTVIELQNGNSNVDFSWHIVANKKSIIGRSTEEKSIYAELRFPDAPNAITPSENKNAKLSIETNKGSKTLIYKKID